MLVLGPVAVVAAGAPVAVTGHAGRLLVELVIRRGAVSRDRLLDALWPVEAPKSADAALRVHLSRLRRLLSDAGVALERRPDGYALAGATSDLDRFDALMGHARVLRDQAGSLDELARASDHVDAALALWRGEPLAPFTDRPELADHVRSVRNRRDEAEDLAAALLLERGLHEPSITILEATVEARPFHERGWARLMVALYRSGRQRDALATFDRARAVLVESLGVEPGPELTRLQHDILVQDPVLEWAPPGPPGASEQPSSPPLERRPPVRVAVAEPPSAAPELIGREAELATLRAAAGRAEEGIHVVVVSGESGIGKTALVEHFAQLQQRPGAAGPRAVVGYCDRNRAVPLHGFLGALAPFIGPDAGAAGAEVAQLLQPSGASAAPVLRAEQLELHRHRVLTALGDLVEDVSRDGPLTVVIDDAQWAGPLSLAFIEHLVVCRREARVLLVLVTRSTAEPAPLDPVLADLSRSTSITRLRVGPLSSASIARIAGSRAGGEGELLHRASGGNPLFALQLGRLIDDIGTTELPAGLDELCRARLAGLPTEVMELLEVAAVLGPEVDAAQLAELLGTSRAALSSRLVAAQRVGLLEVARGLDRFRFVHGVMRLAVYEQIEPGRRAHLHLAAAAVLERDENAGPGDIAVHLAQAHPLVGDEAVAAACLRAANAAIRIGAHDHASRFFRIVIGLSSPGPSQRARAQFGLGLGLAASGDTAGSDAVFAESFRSARDLGRWDLVADTVIARTRYGLAPTIPHALRDVERIDEVLAHLPDAERSRRSYLLCWKGELLMNVSPAAATEAIAAAGVLADELDDEGLRSHVELARVRQLETDRADPQIAVDRAADLVRRATEQDDRRLALKGMMLLQSARLRAGAYAAVAAAQREVFEEIGAGRESGSVLELNAKLIDVGVALATEPLDVADALSEDAGAVTTSGLTALATTARLMQLLQIRLEQQRLVELEPFLAGALEASPRRIFRPVLALCREEQGDAAGARAQLDAFAGELDALMPDWTYLATLALAAEAAAGSGHTALGAALEERLVDQVPQVVVACSTLVVLGHLDRHLGLLAHLRGDLDAAIGRFASAGRFERDAGAPLWAAWAAHGEAVARLERGGRGDRQRARALLEDAADTARRFGSPRLSDRVELARKAVPSAG